MVWSVAKVVPLTLTVSVEVPAASSMVALFTETDSVGAASSSVMVMARRGPMVLPSCEAVISTVSLGSSMMSCTAVTVAVVVVSPALSVTVSGVMV